MPGVPKVTSPQEIRDMLERYGQQALTGYEYTVMAMRTGLGFEGKLHSLEAVGEALGIHRTQVAQIEKRAMAKLRHPQWSEA